MARKAREWFSFNADGANGNPELYIYDYIGKSWWNDRATSAIKVVEKLKDWRGEQVDIHVNSLGGDAFEGQAIHNAVRRHKGGCVCYIDGIAYSAATHVAEGCEHIIIAENALFGIHKGWTWGIGNEDDMLRTAQNLRAVDHAQIVVYAKRTGLSRAEILAQMVKDVAMTAEEAHAAGYCDQLGDEVEIDAAAQARSPLDIAAHRIPDRFAAMMADRGFFAPETSIEDNDLKQKLENARDMARSAAELIEECLEEDEADAESEARASTAAHRPADTPRKVGGDVAALLTLSRFREEHDNA